MIPPTPVSSPRLRWVVRVSTFAATVALASHGVTLAARLYAPKGHSALELAAVALFALCFTWISFPAIVALWGTALLPVVQRASERWPCVERKLTSRVAVLIPIYHEDPWDVCRRVELMHEGLRAHGAELDFYLLSDSTDPERWLDEELAWHALHTSQPTARIFYRRRAENRGKKAENLRDFCLRFSADVDFFIVLDADSLLGARTMIEMIARMEAHPTIGILQAPPLPVGRTTLFARWLQFSAAMYGRAYATGFSAFFGPQATYWGHNAILRADAFVAHCGLAALPGKPPFGGTISSHDFVEAALMRTAGYEVWLAPDLGDSWEQCPTTLIDYAIRDKRWCQGNLQHLAVALRAPVDASSRAHLLYGAFAYLASPLWFLFVLVALLAAAHDLSVEPTYFVAGQRTLFPHWPALDYAAANALLGLTITALLAPRILAAGMELTCAIAGPRAKIAGLASTLLEIVFGTLVAPGLMMFQTLFVLAALTGEHVPWTAQARHDRDVGWKEALSRHGVHVFIAIAFVTGGWLISARTALLALPLGVGLALSPLITVATSRRWLGDVCAKLGLFTTSADRTPTATLVAWHAKQRDSAPALHVSPIALLRDPRLAQLHAWIIATNDLAISLARDERERLLEALRQGRTLTGAEWALALRDADFLRECFTAAACAADTTTSR